MAFGDFLKVVQEVGNKAAGVISELTEATGGIREIFVPSGSDTGQPVAMPLVFPGGEVQKQTSLPKEVPIIAPLTTRLSENFGVPVWSVVVILGGITLLMVAAVFALFKKLFGG